MFGSFMAMALTFTSAWSTAWQQRAFAACCRVSRQRRRASEQQLSVEDRKASCGGKSGVFAFGAKHLPWFEGQIWPGNIWKLCFIHFIHFAYFKPSETHTIEVFSSPGPLSCHHIIIHQSFTHLRDSSSRLCCFLWCFVELHNPNINSSDHSTSNSWGRDASSIKRG